MTRRNSALTVTRLPNGLFDVQDDAGESVLTPFGGPFYGRPVAEQAARMLTAFDQVDKQIEQINDGLRRIQGRR